VIFDSFCIDRRTGKTNYIKGRDTLMMKSKSIVKLLLLFTLIVFFTSNLHAGSSFTFKWGKDSSEPEQQQVKQDNKKGGPPAHAKAHGYRAKHQYRYYPDQKVYHDPDRGLYFYLKGDNWEVGASLPSPLRSALGESVTIALDADNPSVHNDDHVKQYPPKKSNSTKKKRLAKKK